MTNLVTKIRLDTLIESFSLRIFSSDEDNLDHAFDIIQEFDDATWQYFEEQCSSDLEDVNSTHFVTAPKSVVVKVDPLYSSLADVSTSHPILHNILPVDKSTTQTHHQVLFAENLDNSTSREFVWTMVVRRASLVSRLLRYCDHAHISPELTPSNEKFKLGDVTHPSMDEPQSRVPIDTNGNFLEYDSDVVDVYIPILFGLDNMKSYNGIPMR